MFKRIATIGLILIIALSVILKAEELVSISWSVEINTCEDTGYRLYWKDIDEDVHYYQNDSSWHTWDGTIINETQYFGSPVDVLKMGAEAQSEHYFDSVEKYESSHLEAELWLGIAPDPDPGTPGND